MTGCRSQQIIEHQNIFVLESGRHRQSHPPRTNLPDPQSEREKHVRGQRYGSEGKVRAAAVAGWEGLTARLAAGGTFLDGVKEGGTEKHKTTNTLNTLKSKSRNVPFVPVPKGILLEPFFTVCVYFLRK